jgi:hypothetical protein
MALLNRAVGTFSNCAILSAECTASTISFCCDMIFSVVGAITKIQWSIRQQRRYGGPRCQRNNVDAVSLSADCRRNDHALLLSAQRRCAACCCRCNNVDTVVLVVCATPMRWTMTGAIKGVVAQQQGTHTLSKLVGVLLTVSWIYSLIWMGYRGL